MCTQVQDAMSNCFQGVQTFAVNAGEWISSTVIWLRDAIVDYAQKVAEWIKPHWENFTTFASSQFENLKNFCMGSPREATILGVGAGILGAAAAAIGTYFCCARAQTPPPANPSGNTTGKA